MIKQLITHGPTLDSCELPHSLSSSIHPGLGGLPLALKRSNLVGLLHREPDIVKSIEEAMATECINLELDL